MPKLELLKKALQVAGEYLRLLILRQGEKEVKTVQEPTPPTKTLPEAILSDSEGLKWDTPEHVRHSIRVMCDEAGLSFYWKNVITACIYQESNFNPRAIGKTNKNGTTDYGLCQYNNGKNKQGQAYWIGSGAAFTSIEEVLNSPEKNVRVMIEQFKAGNLHLWASFSTDAYLRWLQKVQQPVPLSGHY